MSILQQYHRLKSANIHILAIEKVDKKHQHGNKNRWWIYHRYFHNNQFTDQRITKKDIENHRLYRIGYVPIRYHVKVKAKANPFLSEYDKYFYQRTKWRENIAKKCKQITTFMSSKIVITVGSHFAVLAFKVPELYAGKLALTVHPVYQCKEITIMNKTLINLIVVFLILSALIFLGIYLYEFNSGLSQDHSNWGAFGNYSAGTIGICLSLLSVTFMYLTFKEQRRQRFENNYQQYVFNYHSLLNLIRENFRHKKEHPEYLSGREIFGRSFEVITIDKPIDTFKDIYNTHINVFQHYCNYIVELFEIVYNNNELNDKDRKYYIDRFFSLMSFYEFIFFAYYVKYILENKNSEKINEFMSLKLAEIIIDNNKVLYKEQIDFIKKEYTCANK